MNLSIRIAYIYWTKSLKGHLKISKIAKYACLQNIVKNGKYCLMEFARSICAKFGNFIPLYFPHFTTFRHKSKFSLLCKLSIFRLLSECQIYNCECQIYNFECAIYFLNYERNARGFKVRVYS